MKMYKCSGCGEIFSEDKTVDLFPSNHPNEIRIAIGKCPDHIISGSANKTGAHFVKLDEMETIKEIMRATNKPKRETKTKVSKRKKLKDRQSKNKPRLRYKPQ